MKSIKLSNTFRSFLHALGLLAYVFLVTQMMQNGERIFGDQPDAIIAPFVLTLFVLSAAISAMLVFGMPVMLYLDGHKKSAIAFLLTTLVWLTAFLVVFLVIMFLTTLG